MSIADEPRHFDLGPVTRTTPEPAPLRSKLSYHANGRPLSYGRFNAHQPLYKTSLHSPQGGATAYQLLHCSIIRKLPTWSPKLMPTWLYDQYFAVSIESLL
ncbi:hypothetical protein TNCV_2110041 [Trichonephila clavipes]|nr:hypothetical protein TNCV_2110041 [Trichonephila clavipes]